MINKDNTHKEKTLQAWIDMYEKKTGDKAVLPEGFSLYWLPNRGFAEYKIDEKNNILLIYIICGDGKFWRDLGELICRLNHLKCISSILTRNIEAYIRFWRWEIVKVQNKDEKKRFICRDQLNRFVIITYKGADDNGSPAYWVTQFINKNEVI